MCCVITTFARSSWNKHGNYQNPQVIQSLFNCFSYLNNKLRATFCLLTASATNWFMCYTEQKFLETLYLFVDFDYHPFGQQMKDHVLCDDGCCPYCSNGKWYQLRLQNLASTKKKLIIPLVTKNSQGFKIWYCQVSRETPSFYKTRLSSFGQQIKVYDLLSVLYGTETDISLGYEVCSRP